MYSLTFRVRAMSP